jgi:hypothetical protein
MGRASREKWQRRLEEMAEGNQRPKSKNKIPASAEFCGGAVIALLLFFLDKGGKANGTLFGILLVVMGCLLLHPLLSLEWVGADSGKTRNRRRGGLVFIVLIVVIAFGAWVWPKAAELGKVEIFFSESRRFPATSVPHVNTLESAIANLSETIRKTPINHLHIAPNTGKIIMNVIVRNTSDIPIHNAQVQIMSTTRIVGKTMGAYAFSNKDVTYEERVMVPFNRLGQEYFISIEFEDEGSIPAVGITVTVDGDNMTPYVGQGNFVLIRQP